MFAFLKCLYELNSDLVKNYFLTTEFNGDPMCDSEDNYLFKITIDPILIDQLLTIVIKLEQLEVLDQAPNYYWSFYQKNKPLNDSGDINILSTNTKVRRLGYFNLLIDFIKHEQKVPLVKMNKSFERYSAKEHIFADLNFYDNTKGVINLTKSGTSAKPYVELAEDMGILNKVNNVYSAGKSAKVFQEIQSDLQIKPSNQFKLLFFDRLFYLEKILEKDFLFIVVILELIFIQKTCSYTELKGDFQSAVLKKINNYFLNFGFSELARRKLVEIRNRISNWQKPEVYLEHVLMPRLNWMLDMEIIREENGNYILTEKGCLLFLNICCWYDIENSFILDPKEYLDRFIQHSFSNMENLELKMDESQLDQLKKEIEFCLDRSFEKFKTLAPNRTTASQAILYSKYFIFLNMKIPVEFKFIENYIIRNCKKKYIYKFQHQYGDGYIQLRKQ